MTTKLDGQRDAVPAVQPRLTTAARGTRRTRPGTALVPVGAGVAAGRVARSARPLHPRRDAGRGVEGREASEGDGSIFPRFHQWDAVLKLEADARERGAGQNYLVAALGGSGKSNTIAWLAHRLSTLHNAADEKVFDKVVVITDRVVLDRQLQETIYQFEHVHGVVVKIDKDSNQLAEALIGRAGAGDHHDLAEVPVHPRQGRGAPAAPLRGDRGRGALLADRGGGEGLEARPRGRL